MPLWKLENAVHAGNIIKSHGYLGNVRVAFSFSINQEKLTEGSYIYIEFSEKPVPFLVETIQWTDEENAIVKFAGVDTEESALKILKRNVFLPQDYIIDSEEDEDFELLGFKLVDEKKTVLGEITDLLENGPQSILEAKTAGGKELLIPYHEDIIIKINRKNKTVLVNLPEGLLDL